MAVPSKPYSTIWPQAKSIDEINEYLSRLFLTIDDMFTTLFKHQLIITPVVATPLTQAQLATRVDFRL